MPEQKTIAVVGATGAQGGGLVRAILADPERRFAVRAITRDPASEKGRALAATGEEVVAGNADVPASRQAAFAGAHGVGRTARALNPGLLNFDTWLAADAPRIPVEWRLCATAVACLAT